MNLTITITINGETQPSAAETLAALVEGLGMKPDRVAIELNREIVPREQWPQTPLHDGDRLEIVHFVGGGSGNVRGMSGGLPKPAVVSFLPPVSSYSKVFSVSPCLHGENQLQIRFPSKLGFSVTPCLRGELGHNQASRRFGIPFRNLLP
jgi:thiamine biosynthesis protein ThiS